MHYLMAWMSPPSSALLLPGTNPYPITMVSMLLISVASVALIVYLLVFIALQLFGPDDATASPGQRLVFKDLNSETLFPSMHSWMPWTDTIAFVRETPRMFIRHRFQALHRLSSSRIDADHDAFHACIFGEKVLFVRSPAVFRQVLMGQDRIVSPAWTPTAVETVAGGSVALQSGVQHRRSRRLLAHGFTPKALASYTENICSAAIGITKIWMNHGTDDAYADVVNYMFVSICAILFGRDFSDRRGSLHALGLQELFSEVSSGVYATPINLPFTALGKALKSKKVLLDMIEEEIERERNRPQECNADDGFSFLLRHILKNVNIVDPESDDFMSVDELKSQLLLMMWAGYETGATTLTQTIVELAKRPHLVDQLRQEQNDLGIPASIADGDVAALTAVMAKHSKQMKLHDAVVLEAMRTRPVVQLLMRRAIKHFKIAGRDVQPGWQIALCIDAANSKLDDDINGAADDTFSPDRHQLQSGAAANEDLKWRSIQFGAGMHYCVGRELAMLECRAMISVLVADPHRVVDVPVLPEWIDDPTSRPAIPLKLSVRPKVTTGLAQ